VKRFGASLRASCGTGLTSVRRIHSSSLTYQEGGSEGGSEGGRMGEGEWDGARERMREGEWEGTREGGTKACMAPQYSYSLFPDHNTIF